MNVSLFQHIRLRGNLSARTGYYFDLIESLIFNYLVVSETFSYLFFYNFKFLYIVSPISANRVRSI